MKIEVDIPEKLESPLGIVIERIKSLNQTEVDTEKVLSTVCKQFIISEYSKYLMERVD